MREKAQEESTPDVVGGQKGGGGEGEERTGPQMREGRLRGTREAWNSRWESTGKRFQEAPIRCMRQKGKGGERETVGNCGVLARHKTVRGKRVLESWAGVESQRRGARGIYRRGSGRKKDSSGPMRGVIRSYVVA